MYNRTKWLLSCQIPGLNSSFFHIFPTCWKLRSVFLFTLSFSPFRLSWIFWLWKCLIFNWCDYFEVLWQIYWNMRYLIFHFRSHFFFYFFYDCCPTNIWWCCNFHFIQFVHNFYSEFLPKIFIHFIFFSFFSCTENEICTLMFLWFAIWKSKIKK